MHHLADDVVWVPSEEQVERARLTSFMRHFGVDSFAQLQAQAAAEPAWFTECLLQFLEIRFHKPYQTVLDLEAGIAWPRWCVGGELNITESCLDQHLDRGQGNRPALRWEGEDGQRQELSYQQLADEVGKTANALKGLGLQKGDIIGLLMPMIPQVVIGLLAIARIGAVALPLFSGYGAAAIADRLIDAGARALLTADGFLRAGKLVALKTTADQALAAAPCVEHVIVVRHAAAETPMLAGRDRWWDDLCSSLEPVSAPENTAAEDLLMLIYTSGTTGRPKGAVHTHCGFPVKAAQDMAFGLDVKAEDVIYWMTDMGWMMGPWLVFGSLLLGATMFIYDGSPSHPTPARIWEMVEQHQIEVLGLSPTFVRSILSKGLDPVRQHDLSSLRMFASTGEPWTPDAWHWLFGEVGEGRRPIINYSGGTEISGGILMGLPILPLRPASFAAPCPGIAADVFDEDGMPLRGAVGELVIKAPWIGMTRGFWKDPDRYLETYWSRWAGVWVHGDWASVDEHDTWAILGRSDDTIKVAGKRLGPAEVEAAVNAHPAVIESAAIGVPDALKGSSVVCFCVVAGQYDAQLEKLQQELQQQVIQRLGKPLAPKQVIFVGQLPKTRNGKIMRRMIRSAYLQTDPGDKSALENPQALEDIRRALEANGG